MRRYSLIAYWGLIFGLTHWPDIKDFPHPSWLFPHVDWVVHASMYGGWAAMWLWVLAGPAVRLPSGLSTRLLAGALAYAILDELTQPPFGRTAEIGDVVADMTGVTVVLLLVGWWLRRQKLRKVG